MELLIEISLITVNKQPVEGEHIDDFVDVINRGIKIKPITVRQDGSKYVLVDGRHRLAAYKILNKTHIKAVITL